MRTQRTTKHTTFQVAWQRWPHTRYQASIKKASATDAVMEFLHRLAKESGLYAPLQQIAVNGAPLSLEQVMTWTLLENGRALPAAAEDVAGEIAAAQDRLAEKQGWLMWLETLEPQDIRQYARESGITDAQAETALLDQQAHVEADIVRLEEQLAEVRWQDRRGRIC